MSGNDDFNLDDFTFDDFDDFSDFGSDVGGSKVKDDRKPITKVADSFKRSTKAKVQSPTFYTRLLRKALPLHYREALDTVDEAKAQGRDLYNSAVERSSPTVREIKKRTAKLIPKAKDYLPKKLADRLEKLLDVQDDYNTQFSEAKQREDQIALALGDIFTQQMASDQNDKVERRSTEVFKEAVTSKRHEQTIATSEGIRQGISRLVGYQDKVAFRYQQKSLELQYRQLFATRDIISESQRQSRETIELLKGIVKNTGLPDAVKLAKTEQFGLMGRERFIRRGQDMIGNNLQGLISKVGGNLRNKVTEKVGSISDLLDQGMASADMVGGLGDPLTTAGDFGSNVVTEVVSDNLAKRLGKQFAKSKFLRSTNAKLGAAISNAPSALKNFANTDPNSIDPEQRRWFEQDDSPYEIVNGRFQQKGFLKKKFGSMLGLTRDLLKDNMGEDDLAVHDASTSMSNPVPFSKRMGLSITDVIPGLLARQLREITMLRTGKEAKMLTFDYGSLKFVTSRNMRDKIETRVSSKVGKNGVRSQFDDIMEKVDPENKLAGHQRQALEKHLLINARKGGGFDVNRFANANLYDDSIDEKTRKELAQHFKEQFIDSRQGGRFDNPVLDERIRDTVQSYQGLLQSIPAVLDELELQLSLGNKSVLEEMGLLEDKNGVSTFNFDAIIKLLLKADNGYRSSANSRYTQRDTHSPNASGGPVDTLREQIRTRTEHVRTTASNTTRNVTASASERLQELQKHARELFQNNAPTFTFSGEAIKNKAKGFGANVQNRLSGISMPNLDASGIRGKATDLLNRGKEGASSIQGLLQKRYTTLNGEARSRFDIIKKRMDEQLKRNRFVDSVTGDVVRSFEDIKNDVVDTAGNVIVDVKAVMENMQEPIRQTVDSVRETVQQSPFMRRVDNGFNRDEEAHAEPKQFASDVTPLLERLIEIQSNAYNHIEGIHLLIQSGIAINENGGITGHKQQRHGIRSGLRRLVGGTLAGLGGIASGTGTFYKKVFGKMGGFVGGITGLAGAAAGLGGKFINSALKPQLDIYVRGEKTPALPAKLIKQGRYEDVLTGKVIKTLKDITGPVRDLGDEGNIVITPEDFAKGLYDLRGKSMVKSGFRWLGKFYASMFTPFTTAASLATKSMLGIAKFVTRTKDVYTKDNLQVPKLYAGVMVSGGYYSANSGKVIKSVSDIDGPVKDKDDVIVLSLEDLRKGLCDSRGKPITSLSEKVVNLVKGTVGLGVKAGVGMVKASLATLRGSWNLGKKLFKGIKNKIHVRFGSPEEAQIGMAQQSVSLLEAIYNLLDERLPSKKKALLGDNDGDGDRENSWQDILQSRKEKQKEEADRKAAGAGAAGGGMWSKLSAGLAGLMGKKKDKEEDDDDGDTTIVGDLGLGGDKDKDGKKTKPSKPKGKFGRFMEKVGGKMKKIPGANLLGKGFGKLGGLARGVGSIGARVLGASALTTLLGGEGLVAGGLALGSGLLSVGGSILAGAAAVIGSPIFLGALAVGAVGYLGYRLYKSMKGRTDLRDIRYLQYGILPEADDAHKRVAYLENAIADKVNFSGENGTIDVDMKSFHQIVKDFGVDMDNETETVNFLKWYEGRFKPIYLRHRAAANSLKAGATLEQADSDFSPSMKLSYLSSITIPSSLDGGPYGVYVTPFGKENTLYGSSTINEAIDKAKDYFKEKAEKDGDKVAADTNGKGATKGGVTFNEPGAALAVSAASTDSGKDYNGIAASQSKTNAFRMGGGTVAIGGIVPNLSIDRSVPIIDIVRYKAYGLTTLELDKVNLLHQLEREVIAKITFDSKGNALLGGNGEDYAKLYSSMFGVSIKDEKQYLDWILWFNNRFAPVLVEYCTVVRRLTNSVDILEASKNLKPDQNLEVASTIVAAKSSWFGSGIWGVTNSPWFGYLLSTDSSITQGNIEALKEQSKQRVLMDKERVVTTTGTSALPTPAAPSTPYTMIDKARPTTFTPQTPVGNPNNVKPTTTYAGANDNDGDVPPPAATDGRRTFHGLTTKAVSGGKYSMPAAGRISSDFGVRADPFTGKQKGHKGVDIAAPAGTPIYAMTDGVILRRYFSPSYGNVIYIKHDDGKASRYAHMSSFQPGFREGSRVNQGDLIGYVGSTGNSTGAHLHFEVRANDKDDAEALDPMQYIDGSTSTAAKKELAAEKTALKKDTVESTKDTMEGQDTVSSSILMKATNPSFNGKAAATPSAAPQDPSVTSAPISSPLSNAMNPLSTRQTTTSSISVPDISRSESLNQAKAPSDNAVAILNAQREARSSMIDKRNSARTEESFKNSSDISSILADSLKVHQSSNALLGDVHKALLGIREDLSARSSSPADTASATTTGISGKRPVETRVKQNPVDLRKASLQ